MLDMMGPRTQSHRTFLHPWNECSLAQGYHATRRGPDAVSQDGYGAVFDGRLENASGQTLSEPGKLIVEIYRTQGVSGFVNLRGEFAFVLWDPVKHLLVCARDALGTRPLYYRAVAGGFSFASEERGLSPLFGSEPPADIRIAEFFAGLVPPTDRGWRPTVFRVIPGTAVLVDAAGLRIESFDSLDLQAECRDNLAQQARIFHDLLKDAVRRRCDAEIEIDCFLSGGLDSSSLFSLVSSLGQGSLRALSLINASRPELSEEVFINAALQGHDVEAVKYDVGQFDPYAGAQEALARHAGPFSAPNLLMMRPLYDAARPGSILLDGHGGDEVVSKGTGRLFDLARGGRWIALYVELRGVADLYGEDAWTMFIQLYLSFGPGRHKLKAFLQKFCPKALNVSAQIDDPLDYLSESFREASGADEAFSQRRQARPSTGRAADHAVLLQPQQTYALELLDREAQASGVVGQYPFWDRALIDYSMSLPTWSKLKRGWTRFILRKAMIKALPEMILWRRDKHDFSQQLEEGLLRSHVVSLENLAGAKDCLRRYLDVDRLLELRANLEKPDVKLNGATLQFLWRVGLWILWSRANSQVTPACSLNSRGHDVPQ